MVELKSHYCEESGCLRKVFYPHLYCDKHVDHASNPDLVATCQRHNSLKVSEKVVVHKASGGYPHPTLCGQYISYGFNKAEKDSEVTCTKCLRKMKDGKA